MEESFYLELCSDPIRFDSVSQITDVFFDDSNKQVSQANYFNGIVIFNEFHLQIHSYSPFDRVVRLALRSKDQRKTIR